MAQDRELASHDPAQRVKLPATAAKARDRVATPGEFAALIAALYKMSKERQEEVVRSPRDALRDAVPFALAGYATARSQEIRILDWEHVNLDLGAVELARGIVANRPAGDPVAFAAARGMDGPGPSKEGQGLSAACKAPHRPACPQHSPGPGASPLARLWNGADWIA